MADLTTRLKVGVGMVAGSLVAFHILNKVRAWYKWRAAYKKWDDVGRDESRKRCFS